MSDLSTQADPADITPAEAGSRGPMLFLLGSGLLWLLLSGILALIASIQVHTPGFLACCSVLTFGRVQAMAETAFIYGWIGNTGIGLALWMLGRLSAEPLRAANWAVVGTAFWNLALLFSVIGIALGEGTGIPGLQMPSHLQRLMLLAYGAIGIALVLAWTGRRRDRMFASQWYAVAAVFLFPWIFAIAQVVLLAMPGRGVVQAIAAGWFAQSLWTLWMAPLALAGAYYVVGRMSTRVLPSYDMALLGFWSLIVVGGLTGGRHLIDGPVPAWIPTVAIVMSFVLLVHYLIVFLNLRGSIAGGGIALRFIGLGLLAYVAGGLLDAITSLRFVAVTTQYTFFDQAQTQLAVYGGVSLLIFGTLYFALPRIAGAPWSSSGLARGHLVLAVLGVLLLVVSLGAAGWTQGTELNNPGIPFREIAVHIHPWLVAASVANAVLLLANLLLTVNFFKTLVVALNPMRRIQEVLVS